MRALLAFTLVLLSAVVTPPALAQAVDGQISGVVVDATGQPLADQRVELRGPTRQGGTRLVTATDMNGQFAYARLRAGHYEVELRVEGRVIARSGPIELSEGAMRVNGITLARPAARPAAPRRRVSLDGQPVTDSFEALQSILPGYEVAVRDTAGRTTRGRVVSISSDQLVVARPRPFWRIFTNPFRVEEQTFAEDVVTSIHTEDPLWNGVLLGAAPGIVYALAVCPRWERANPGRNSVCKPFAFTMWVPMGIGVGIAIDKTRLTRRIYDRQPQTPGVTIAPWLERDRKGVMVQVHF